MLFKNRSTDNLWAHKYLPLQTFTKKTCWVTDKCFDKLLQLKSSPYTCEEFQRFHWWAVEQWLSCRVWPQGARLSFHPVVDKIIIIKILIVRKKIRMRQTDRQTDRSMDGSVDSLTFLAVSTFAPLLISISTILWLSLILEAMCRAVSCSWMNTRSWWLKSKLLLITA